MPGIAYLSSTFPALSTTFVQHEVRILETLDLKIVLTANRAPDPGRYHPEDDDLIGRTFYLTPVNPFRYLKANLSFFIKSPRRYLTAIKQALALKDDYPWQRTRNLAQLAGAAVLAGYLTDKSVIHVHVHFAFGAASVALLLKTLTGIPYSLTIHGSDVLLPRPLTEEKLKQAKFVVSNCQFHINNLRKRFPSLDKQRFYVIRIGLDLQAKPWSQMKPYEKDPDLHILNIARLERVKAQDILIRACARLQNMGVGFHCRIVGDGPGKKELEKLIKQSSLEDKVELLGPRFQDEIIKLYGWSHVLVLSSLSEGTPMTVIEAMAQARPVIVPNITALPEMVVEGKTGYLFKKASHEDLAIKLRSLAGKPELIRRLGIEGRKKAEELFDLTVNARHLMAVFDREIPELRLSCGGEINHE
jgi:colanic acid/amylovoran biosynthesis glycosyltransferase